MFPETLVFCKGANAFVWFIDRRWKRSLGSSYTWQADCSHLLWPSGQITWIWKTQHFSDFIYSFFTYFLLSSLPSFTYSCFSGLELNHPSIFLFPSRNCSPVTFSILHISFYPLCIIYFAIAYRRKPTSKDNLFLRRPVI